MTIYLTSIYNYFSSFFLKKKVPYKPKETIVDTTNKYIQKAKTKFLSLFDETNEAKRKSLNSNMTDIFYLKKEYKELLQVEHNSLEKQWEMRILLENTPQGNIMMFYNTYRQGFSYYSDINGINYKLLNAVAMKYVNVFKCLDLFVDDEITPEKNTSPLIKIHFKEETKKQKEEREKIERLSQPKTKEERIKDEENEILKAKLLNGPFAKLKKTNVYAPSPLLNGIANKNENMKKTNKKIDPLEKEFNRNRFISMGKMVNFNFIQSKIYNQSKNKNMKLNKFSSSLLDNLNGEMNLQKEVMNYKDYKKLLKK